MKKISLFLVTCLGFIALLAPSVATAQKQTYDLVTYTPPKGWQKDVAATLTSYTAYDEKTKNWCRINIVKSTISKGTIDKDFESEWQELVVKNYQPSTAPTMNEVAEADGWKAKSGAAKFIYNKQECLVILTTMSGYNRCVSIAATANNADYIKDIDAFLASIQMGKPKTAVKADTTKTSANNNTPNANNKVVLGTWTNSASDQDNYSVNNGINGYISRQYTFNGNGTYTFYIRTFSYVSDKLLLTKENGTYQVNGNNITINPQKSVIQSWTKKNGVDDWGKLVSSQNQPLEQKTYQFQLKYFSGIKETDLVLQGDQPTKRDGPFNGGNAFAKAWIYSPLSASNPLIKLPE